MFDDSLKGQSMFPKAQNVGRFTVIELWKTKQSKPAENIHIKRAGISWSRLLD